MTAGTLSCPSCGASHSLSNPGIVSVTCSYCGTTVFWDRERVSDQGKKSALSEGFTRLYTGAAGSIRSHRFLVLGRVRYGFDRGFWDEWYLELEDGRTAWLTEDDHELALESPVTGVEIGAFERYRPGARLAVEGTMFVVEEVGQATCLGIEGQLPTSILPEETYPYVDASSPDGDYTLAIEYDDDPPTVFRGRWIKHTSLKLDDEGVEW